MTTTITPARDLAAKLKAIEADLSDLRARRAVAAKDAETAKAAFARTRSMSTKSAEYAAAKLATDRVRDLDSDIADRQQAQVGCLKMLGRDGKPDAARETFKADDINKPGGWLAREVRKAMTTDDIGSVDDTGRVFFDRLRERSALLASGVPTLDIDTTEIRVPVMTGRVDPAVPIAELDPIPEADPPVENTTIKPPKYPKLVTLSLEALRDARPVVLAATERELVGSIGEGFDLAAFAGAVGSPQVGIINVSGVVAVDATGGWTNLDPIAEAKAQLRTAGATPTAIYAHPLDYEIASKMKESTGSNKPLVAGTLAGTDTPAEALLGVPVYQSTGVPRHKLVVAEAAELLVVRRSLVETDINENYKFDVAGAGIRTIARMSLVVVQPEAVAVVSLPTS